jgi:nicotinamidase-related amidase
MLNHKDTVFVLIDVQGKLAGLMHEKERLFENLEKLLRGMQALNVPIIWMEQIPEKMGPTIVPLRQLLGTHAPIPKTSFSCGGSPAFMEQLKATRKKQVLLAGIETHVCVYQTAADLVRQAYHVEVAADAVSSRRALDRDIALRKIDEVGAYLTTVETAIFELLRTADHPKFRDILAIVK